AGEVHGVVDGRVVQVEGELIVHLLPLDDLLHLLDGYAENRLADAMVQQDRLVALLSQRTTLPDNLYRGHYCSFARQAKRGRSTSSARPALPPSTRRGARCAVGGIRG